jgi:hypothetical protein
MDTMGCPSSSIKFNSINWGIYYAVEIMACSSISQFKLVLKSPQAHSGLPYECHQVREVFDLGFVEDSWTGYTQPVRLIVVRTPHNPKRKHRIGKKRGDFIYELFITSHPQNGLSGCDLLSLYYGRGGERKAFGR